jgi:hypothetical protein
MQLPTESQVILFYFFTMSHFDFAIKKYENLEGPPK